MGPVGLQRLYADAQCQLRVIEGATIRIMNEPKPGATGILRASWVLFLQPLIRAVGTVVGITALVGWFGFRASSGESVWRLFGMLPLRVDAAAPMTQFLFVLIALVLIVYVQHLVLIWNCRRRKRLSLSQLARLPQQERLRLLEGGDE